MITRVEKHMENDIFKMKRELGFYGYVHSVVEDRSPHYLNRSRKQNTGPNL